MNKSNAEAAVKPAVAAEEPATSVDKPAAAAPPGGPVSGGWKGILRVNRIFDETSGVKTFRFTAMDGGPIPFTYLPGQDLSVFPMIDGNRTQHCYTIASSPTQRHYCELTIERLEEGQGVSKYLHDGLQEGKLLEASGPTGKFTFTGAEAKSIVLIGDGIGITPLMSVIRYLTDIGWPGDIFFLYSCRHVSDFIFRPELERLCARHPKLHLVVTITEPNEEPWSGLTGLLTKELIAQSVPDIATRRVHICGPDKMLDAVQGALLELDVPAAQVKTEAYSSSQIASAEDGEKHLNMFQRVLLVDPATGFYKTRKYGFDRYFGPVDLGIHLTEEYQSLNFGVGIFAGSIFPGSNRLVVTGFSPCWQGDYISTMGGAGLVFDNLGINMLSLVGKAPVPSVLYLNRNHGEEIEVEVVPIDVESIWKSGRTGVYSLTDRVYEMFGTRYENDPRILVAGPAALHTDMGGIMSVPITKGKISNVNTWAGRGGFGSAMAQNHGIVAIIYGGTVVTEDFRDRKVADDWFRDKYNLRLLEKDKEATQKYRYDEKLQTGGTFGVNYATMGGRIMAFNYRTIYQTEDERTDLHQNFVVNHYLKQFNEETIDPKQQTTCGEPCMAVCKKMNGIYKKDYEPYQTMGPLCGIFDQRAAEKLNHHCDAMGFDAISGGGVLAWLMDLLDGKLLTVEELGVTRVPRWDTTNFDVINDSMHNAELGCELIDAILERCGILDFREGVRKWSRIHSREKGTTLHDRLVYIAFSRRGWMVPNQYWVAGALAPMTLMGKYYMVYSNDFIPPRELGKRCAERMKKELILDNLGICRFHRDWAEELLPEVMGSLYDCKDQFLRAIDVLASRLNSCNSPVFWESERDIDYLHTFLRRKKDIDNEPNPELSVWLEKFDQDRVEAARDFWYETLKGINESLLELPLKQEL